MPGSLLYLLFNRAAELFGPTDVQVIGFVALAYCIHIAYFHITATTAL